MKRLLALLLCIVCLFSVTTAYADGSTALQLFGYQQKDQTLDVFFYAKDDTQKVVSYRDNITLKVGDTELKTDKLVGLSDSDYGSSWVAVVEPARYPVVASFVNTVIDGVVEQLGSHGNMTVLNAVSGEQSAPVNDLSTVRSCVKTATDAHGDIRLYDSISAAIATLNSGRAEINTHKCILIISECLDSKSSAKLTELYNEINQSEITVYTVGITYDDQNRVKAFKELSSLSDATPSGLSVSYSNLVNNPGSEAKDLILENEESCYVASADISELSGSSETKLILGLNGSEVSMHVTLDLPEKPKKEEKKQCEHEWDDDATCEHARTCKKCGIEDPDGEPVDHEYEDGECIWCGKKIGLVDGIIAWIQAHILICAMGLLLLVLLIILLVVAVKRGKRNADELEEGGTQAVFDGLGETDSSDEGPNVTRIIGKVTIDLINKVSGEKFTGEIFNDTLKAGRAAELRLESDGSISREQMEFIWQNGVLYVQDANSSNGTMVNGSRITRAVPLHQGDVIHAGESDFVITWRTNR